MKQQTGFTLIELLIFMALFMIVSTAALNYFMSTTRANSVVVQREQLRSEMTVANQFLISRLREACQVYPQGTSLTLADVPGTTHGSTRSWTVGTDPMAAVITPTDGVPMLHVFYLLDRQAYIDQTTDDAQKIFPLNTTRTSNVLMEYIVPLAAEACTTRPTTLPTTNASAKLVTQLVRPPQTGEPAFQVGSDSAVTYQLRFESPVPSTPIVVPSLSTSPLKASVIGRNIN